MKAEKKHTTPIVSSAGLGHVAEGINQLEVKGERLVVDVRMTMLGQWPEKREILMAHPLSGPPRFPWTVGELLEWGGVFKRVA